MQKGEAKAGKQKNNITTGVCFQYCLLFSFSLIIRCASSARSPPGNSVCVRSMYKEANGVLGARTGGGETPKTRPLRSEPASFSIPPPQHTPCAPRSLPWAPSLLPWRLPAPRARDILICKTFLCD